MRILLTGFTHSSAEQLLALCPNYDILYLPNDKHLDAVLLKKQLLKIRYDLVLCIGQKPNMKDRVSIETQAKRADKIVVTDVNCEELVKLFIHHGISAKLSDNAGTSYCNALYWNGLQFIRQTGIDVKMVFIHIPYEKNIGDFIAFGNSFLNVLKALKTGGEGI